MNEVVLKDCANHGFFVDIPDLKKRILGLGADANGSFCVFDGKVARVSKNYGSLYYVENMDRFVSDALKARGALSGRLDAVVCDLHPGYASREYAREIAAELGCETVGVQHHVAHVYSCAFEHGLGDDFAGIACDGTGYGTDGKIWGGEVFSGDKRVGSLEEQMMVGGESAVLYPRKMLFGIVSKFLSKSEISGLKIFDKDEAEVMRRQVDERFNVFETTSCGRVLDAVSAFLGLCSRRSYDGEPAIVLEKHATGAKPYDIKPAIKKKDRWVLNTTALFEFIYENIDKDKGRLAATAHNYIASGLFDIAKKYHKDIVFSGGVAYNSIISGFLEKKGVFLNRRVARGDYGVSFGQCAYAGLKMRL